MNTKNRTKKSAILLSVLVVLCCVSLIVGATLALFSGRDTYPINISSGDIAIETQVSLDGVLRQSGTQSEPELIDNADGSDSMTIPDGVSEGGTLGTVAIADPAEGAAEGTVKAISLTGLGEGTGARFTLTITNKSNIAMKYIAYIDTGAENEQDFARASLTYWTVENGVRTQAEGGRTVAFTEGEDGNWVYAAPVTDTENGVTAAEITLEIFLPLGAKGGSADDMALVVEAVQSNAFTGNVSYGGAEYETVDEALNALADTAEPGSSHNIYLGEGEFEISGESLQRALEAVGNGTLSITGQGSDTTTISGPMEIVTSGNVEISDVTLGGLSVSGNAAAGASARTMALSARSSDPAVSLNGVAVKVADENAVDVTGVALTMSDSDIVLTNTYGGADNEPVSAIRVSGGSAVFTDVSIDADYSRDGASPSARRPVVYAGNGAQVSFIDCAVDVNTDAATSEYRITPIYVTGDQTRLTLGGDTAVVLEGRETALSGNSNGDGAYVDGNAVFAMEGNASLTAAYGPFLCRGAAFDISGNAKVEAAYFAINGNNTKGTMTINIADNAQISSLFDVAIYMPNVGTINMTGGTIEGNWAGIHAKMGTIDISGGTVRATGEKHIVDVNGSYTGNGEGGVAGGTSKDGSAIVLHSDMYTANPDVGNDYTAETSTDLTLRVSGAAVLESENWNAISYYKWNKNEQNVSLDGGNYDVVGVISYNGTCDGNDADAVSQIREFLANGDIDKVYYHGNSLPVLSEGETAYDLAGKTLETDQTYSTTVGTGASLILSNGTLIGNAIEKSNLNFLCAENGGTIQADKITLYTMGSAFYAKGQDATVKVTDSLIDANGYCVSTNAGSADNHGVIIELLGSEFISNRSAGTAIILNVPGKLTMEDCTVDSQLQSVIVRGGTATLTRCTLTNVVPDEDYFLNNRLDKDWGSGNDMPTGALVIGNRGTSYQYPSNVTLVDTEINAVTDGSLTVYIYGNATEELGAALTYQYTDSFAGEKLSSEKITIGGGYVTVNGVQAVVSAEQLQTAVNEGGNVVLFSDLEGDISVPAGVEIVIDLGGYQLNGSVVNNGTLTLQSAAEGGITAPSDHAITNNGKLTIESGIYDALAHGKAAVVNNQGATFTMTDGTLTRSQEKEGNSYYVFLNHGSAEISGGSVEKTSLDKASLIANGFQNSNDYQADTPEAVLDISGGNFSGGMYIKNDEKGVLNISGGEFRFGTEACVLNWNKLTIDGGIFYGAEGPVGKVAILTGRYDVNYAIGETVINGGTFYGGFQCGGYYPSYLYYEGVSYRFDDSFVFAEDAKAYVGTVEQLQMFVNEGIDVALLADVTGNITIPAEADIEIDFNGFKMSGSLINNGTLTLKSAAEGGIEAPSDHAITNNGTLTIESGLYDALAHGKAACVNYGTFTMNGGTLTRSQAKGTYSPNAANGNSYYAFINRGTAEFVSGTVKMNDGYSSLIQNYGTSAVEAVMTIAGGNFVGGCNTIKNDDYGVMTISGGKFENFVQACVLNWNELTLKGGEYILAEEGQATFLTGYTELYGEGADKGITVIAGGTYSDCVFGFMDNGESIAKNVTYKIEGNPVFENVTIQAATDAQAAVFAGIEGVTVARVTV